MIYIISLHSLRCLFSPRWIQAMVTYYMCWIDNEKHYCTTNFDTFGSSQTMIISKGWHCQHLGGFAWWLDSGISHLEHHDSCLVRCFMVDTKAIREDQMTNTKCIQIEEVVIVLDVPCLGDSVDMIIVTPIYPRDEIYRNKRWMVQCLVRAAQHGCTRDFTT